MILALRLWRVGFIGLVFALAASVVPHSIEAKELRFLYQFDGKDGAWPYSRLLIDGSENLYGTTLEGGATGCYTGCGTVFRLAPDGTETVLYSFKAGTDGDYPYAGVIADTSGNLYGTTSEGGGSACNGLGCGTVFKLAPDGTETVLYSFQGGTDGANPVDDLIWDASGNLYGTTVNGGSIKSCNFHVGCGTVFKLTPNGTETVLFAFKRETDGENPQGGVTADNSGNLYGTTLNGGSNNNGVVYKLAPDGRETVLHAFQGNSDGNWPYGDLSIDQGGNLYGTTQYGGDHDVGTVFRVSPDGTKTLLHSFDPDTTEGYNPTAGVILDSRNNLYGVTVEGGDASACMGGCGTTFRPAPDGTYTVLHALKIKEGAFPAASLAMDRVGRLYGTAVSGGKRACYPRLFCGTVFAVDR